MGGVSSHDEISVYAKMAQTVINVIVYRRDAVMPSRADGQTSR